MRSTDHNLNNPMEVGTINLYPSIDCTKLSEVVRLPMEMYELIKIKDPTCIYIITDSPTKKVYYGDWLVDDGNVERIYLLGPSNKFGEYILYLNETDGIHDNLIKICRYSDPQVAINDLNKFNRVGSHQQTNLRIYNVVGQYITKDISLHDMLVGIICLFGYRDSSKLQSLLQATTAYRVDTNRNDLPIPLKNTLLSFYNIKNPVFGFYASLYDLVVSYNFFKGKEFQKDPDELDLSKVIEKVFVIMTSHI